MLKKMSLLLICLSSFYGEAQNIFIPDQNFKEKLMLPFSGINSNNSAFRIDSNNDGEISQNEALAVYSFNINLLVNQNIASLEGIAYFTNLRSLDCSYNQISSLDLSTLSNLEKLFCGNNLLTVLDLSSQPQLTTLICSNNLLTSLDLSTSNTIHNIDCSHNALTSIDVSNQTDLWKLTCAFNQITNVNLSQSIIGYSILDVSYNQISELTFPNGSLFQELNVSGNLYTTLDLSNITSISILQCMETNLTSMKLRFIPNLYINNNPYLIYLNYQNGVADVCHDDTGFGCWLDMEIGGTPIEHVCVDDLYNEYGESEVTYLTSVYGFMPGINISSNCNLSSEFVDASNVFSLIPNPASNELNFSISENTIIESVAIYNTLGQLMLTAYNNEIKSITVNVSSLKSGIYFATLHSSKGKSSQSFIKQ